jgi:hypothetical protein
VTSGRIRASTACGRSRTFGRSRPRSPAWARDRRQCNSTAASSQFRGNELEATVRNGCRAQNHRPSTWAGRAFEQLVRTTLEPRTRTNNWPGRVPSLNRDGPVPLGERIFRRGASTREDRSAASSPPASMTPRQRTTARADVSGHGRDRSGDAGSQYRRVRAASIKSRYSRSRRLDAGLLAPRDYTLPSRLAQNAARLIGGFWTNLGHERRDRGTRQRASTRIRNFVAREGSLVLRWKRGLSRWLVDGNVDAATVRVNGDRLYKQTNAREPGSEAAR